MQLTVFSVVLFAMLMSREGQARIKPPETDPYSHLDDVALEILTKCYGNRTSTIGLAGDTSDYLLKSLSSRKHVGVTLLTPMDRKRAHHKMTGSIPYHRLSVFVITSPLSRYGPLEFPTWEIVTAIKRSVWWNHQASYVIILKMEKGCWQSHQHFVSFWDWGIMNVNLICNNVKSSPYPWMLTFNPYVNWAPKPWWHIASVALRGTTTPLSIFMRRYRNNEKMCDQLDFDKTQNLGGWALIVDWPLSPLEWLKIRIKYTVMHMNQTKNHVMHTLLRQMNATYEVVPISKWQSFVKGMSLNIGPITETGLAVSYPFRYIGSTFASKFRGHKTQLEKILGVVDRGSQVATCLTLLVTVMFFKFFIGQDLVSAFLNVLRAVCNTGLRHVGNNFQSQVFIATILFFMLVMQGIFQGDLATLLTTAVPNRNINSVKDLIELGSNIYTQFNFSVSMIPSADFKGRIIEYGQKLGTPICCYPFLKNDTSGVCVGFVNFVLWEVECAKFLGGENLHVSDQMFKPFPYGQYLQHDFPLDIRINNILQRMFESDIVQPFIVKALERHPSDPEFRYDEKVLANKKVSVMTFNNLEFAFVILGSGLACAIIVFIGEIVVSQVRSRKRTIRIRPFK